MPDELAHIKEQIQMLHERLEIVENYLEDRRSVEMLVLKNDINNLKLAINALRDDKL